MIKRTVLASASAVLLVLSFPNFDFEYLAWFAFVPLFFAIEGQKPSRAFLLSYICGAAFFLGTIYWLIHVTLPGMIIVVLYLALYFGLFGFFSSCALRVTPANYGLLFFIPCLWVALELARSHFLTGFGWALLAHSQSYTLPVIQIADITGSYGVSFLVMLVNAAVFLTIRHIRKKEYRFGYLAAALFILYISVAYGTFRLKNIFTGEAVKIAVIQGDIPQAKKWDAKFREEIIAKYERLTRQAARDKPDLIVWPETSVPGFLESERDLFERVRNMSIEAKAPLLAGAPSEARNGAYYNSAFLFSGDGRLIDRYDKTHLVPFGEYVPARDMLSFVENFAPSPIGDFSAGKNYTVFKFLIEKNANDYKLKWKIVRKVKFSSLICFEDIFPDLARGFVKSGAGFLVNITNDAWFGPTSAAYQHAQSSIFRAVENRVNVIRAANTGLSCFIDQKGRINGKVESGGRSLFVEGFRIHEIILANTRTIYTMYGDVFANLCVFLAILYIFIRRNTACPR